MRLLGTRGRGPPRRVVPSQNGNASGTCAWVYDNFSIRSNSLTSVKNLLQCRISATTRATHERNGCGSKMVRRRYTGSAGDNARHRPKHTPHVCPRQGRRRPSPSFCAAGTGGVATAENYGARRDNVCHRPKHSPTRLPPAGPPEALAEFLCRRRRRRSNG